MEDLKRPKKHRLNRYLLFSSVTCLSVFLLDQFLVKIGVIEESIILSLPLWAILLLLIPVVLLPIFRFIDIENFRKNE